MDISIIKWIFLKVLLLLTFNIVGQQKLELDGQLITVGSFSPDNELDLFLGGRYIPRLSYLIPLDSMQTNFFDLEASANINGDALFSPFDTSDFTGNIQPYRAWARFNAAKEVSCVTSN